MISGVWGRGCNLNDENEGNYKNADKEGGKKGQERITALECGPSGEWRGENFSTENWGRGGKKACSLTYCPPRDLSRRHLMGRGETSGGSLPEEVEL